MDAHENDITTTRPDYIQRVATAIDELDQQRADAIAMPTRTDAEHAIRATRLALVSARRAAWWGLLARRTYRDRSVHNLFGHAALVAQLKEKDNARFWRDSAADWRARAEHRPTSDAAGALSNWAELGWSA